MCLCPQNRDNTLIKDQKENQESHQQEPYNKVCFGENVVPVNVGSEDGLYKTTSHVLLTHLRF